MELWFNNILNLLLFFLQFKAKSDIDTNRYGLLLLANLASNPNMHEELMKYTLRLCIAYTKCNDLLCRQVRSSCNFIYPFLLSPSPQII